MSDHANEMFLKWKDALNAGDFSKAEYFQRGYFQLVMQEKTLKDFIERNNELQKEIVEHRSDNESNLCKIVELENRLEVTEGAWKRAEEQLKKSKEMLEKERSKKK